MFSWHIGRMVHSILIKLAAVNLFVCNTHVLVNQRYTGCPNKALPLCTSEDLLSVLMQKLPELFI